MADRIATLLSWVEESPDDGFSRYALALEYKKHDQPEKALEQFSELIKRQPDYHATYYQYGVLLASNGQQQQAKQVLQQGLEVTKRLGEEHAFNEITEALANLTSED